uniref:Cystatin n=1 Tax=Rhipicephalus appendiculatus TaxID=34631 RepID=A0A131YE15_RHIAP
MICTREFGLVAAHDEGFAKDMMAAVHASMLLIGLLMSFCKKSLEAGGWTEERTPDTLAYRSIAQYAYETKKPRTRNAQGITYLVTQARWKVEAVIMYNLGFIVFRGDEIVEKCLTIVVTPLPGRPRRRGVVTKFWCR